MNAALGIAVLGHVGDLGLWNLDLAKGSEPLEYEHLAFGFPGSRPEQTGVVDQPTGAKSEGRAGHEVINRTKETGEPVVIVPGAQAGEQLAPLSFNPLEAGLRALQRPLPGAPVPDELHLAPGDSLGVAGQKIFRRQAFKMEANTEGTLLDLDPEFLHDVRVATRRARFALRLLRPVFGAPSCEALREELRWIAGLLGEVRDLDVFRIQVGKDLARAQIAPEDGAWITEELGRQRDRARAVLVPALQSDRFRSLIQALRNLEPPLLEPGMAEPDTPGIPPETPAESVAPVLVQDALRRVRKWRKRPLAELAPPDLHRLRIHFKRLRYTAEYFADLFSDDFRKAIRRLIPFQDALGAHQDAIVALARLQSMFENRSPHPPLTPTGLLAFGALLQVQRERALAQRALFESLWPDFPRLAKKF